MQLIKQIKREEVILEWLQAEWYKSYYDRFRQAYTHLITNPDITNKKENTLRKEILFTTRHDVIAPFYTLPCTWYKAILSLEDIIKLFVIPASDWYTITDKTFLLKKVPDYVQTNLVGHTTSILKQLEHLKKGKKLSSNIILVGSSEDDITIIEGNHRLSALMMFLTEIKNHLYQQEVTIGFTSEIHKYRWSVKWEKIHEFLQLCKDEHVSFYL